MTDYSNLIKRLHTCATEAAPCKTCDMADNPSCSDDLMLQAANVIFELSLEVGDLKRQVKARSITVQIPKWISVKDKLPEDSDESVLVCTEEYGKSFLGFATAAKWNGSFWLSAWDGKTSLCSVTHWMPLPQPPKEES